MMALPESTDLIARRIADAGLTEGLRTSSDIREAIFKQAVADIRKVRGEVGFYGTAEQRG